MSPRESFKPICYPMFGIELLLPNPLPQGIHYPYFVTGQFKTHYFLFPANYILSTQITSFLQFCSCVRSNLLQQDKNSGMFSLNFLIFTPFDSLMLIFSCSDFNFFFSIWLCKMNPNFFELFTIFCDSTHFWFVVFD